ncbi:MAG: ABC transporter permease [Thermoplasmata archaeon]|nr:ABC transporter permease [Thermoplasmata archaeon]MVT12751.1 ABC transporter permease subunit [Euryarchaeota archaeon]MVT14880.1 ABC transporter permease subunit [Euryarchaeota archaeon]MVT35388.1 ABC transporter permease subunit [Euryarchaeota archaeon]
MAGLARYYLVRTLESLVTYVIIIAVVFWLLYLYQPNPLILLNLNPQLTESQKEYLANLFGFNKPLWERFFIYMWDMLTFNFGISYYYVQPVNNLLIQRIPRTLLLFGGATIIAYVIGYFVGTVIAWKRGGVLDGSNVVVGLIFYNMPVYWLGMIFIFLFAFQLKLFPLANFYDPTDKILGTVLGNNPPLGLYILDILWHTALPMIVLTLISFAGTVLLMRTSMLDVLGENYIDTAIAKGLKEKEVIYNHAARNALLPLVTSFVISMAFAIGGGVLTETVFSYQGVGLLFIQALGLLDYPVVEATTIIIALLVIIFNWIADLIYAYLDPRVRVA